MWYYSSIIKYNKAISTGKHLCFCYAVKKSCVYCGRIHDSKYDCGKKPKRFKKKNSQDAFRSTAMWQKKTQEIKTRDSFLCQVCIRDMYGTINRLNHNRLSVHHAIPLQEDYELRLDNDNLLTLCDMHHEQAESGAIPYTVIREIIDEQESGISPGGRSDGKNERF